MVLTDRVLKNFFHSLGLFVLALASLQAKAMADPLVVPSDPPIKPLAKPKVQATTRSTLKKVEKDVDGTQAKNRFEGDPVIKSRYQLNGQALEVDTD